MRSTLLAALLACLPALAAGAQARPQRIAVVMDGGEPAERPVFEKIAREFSARAAVARYELSSADSADPIKKGRLLAELQNRDLVVAVGNGATEFVTRELEDVPVYFVGAAVVDGASLASPSVAGLFSYSVDSLLDAVAKLKLGEIGLIYTPGYEAVAGWIGKGAADRGLVLRQKEIASLKELAPAMRGLLERSRVIWVAGDPLLARGAGLEYTRERTLSVDVPMMGLGEWCVRHGFLLGYEPKPRDLAAAAVGAIDEVLRGAADPARRLQPAPPGGVVLLNAALADKWKLGAREGPTWRMLR